MAFTATFGHDESGVLVTNKPHVAGTLLSLYYLTFFFLHFFWASSLSNAPCCHDGPCSFYFLFLFPFFFGHLVIAITIHYLPPQRAAQRRSLGERTQYTVESINERPSNKALGYLGARPQSSRVESCMYGAVPLPLVTGGTSRNPQIYHLHGFPALHMHDHWFSTTYYYLQLTRQPLRGHGHTCNIISLSWVTGHGVPPESALDITLEGTVLQPCARIYQTEGHAAKTLSTHQDLIGEYKWTRPCTHLQHATSTRIRTRRFSASGKDPSVR